MIKFDFKNTIENFNTENIEKARLVYKNTKPTIHKKYIDNGWINKYIVSDYETQEIFNILNKAREIKDSASTLIVLCSSTTMYALKAVIDPLKNSVSDILFLGDSLSATNLFYVLDKIKDNSVYLYVISDDLSRPEIGAHFRVICNWFKKKYGNSMSDRIMVATREGSTLVEVANQMQLEVITYEKDFQIEYIAYHPAAYLPLYVAGVNLSGLKKGAKNMIQIFSDDISDISFEEYIILRWVALSEGIENENVCSFDPRLEVFCAWRSRLKGNDMLYRGFALFIRDNDNYKYYHQKYKSKIMETMIDVTVPNIDIVVKPIHEVNDGLNHLDNMGFNQLNYAEYEKIITQHKSEGMKVNQIKCGIMNSEVLGSLAFFFIITGFSINEIIYENKK